MKYFKEIINGFTLVLVLKEENFWIPNTYNDFGVIDSKIIKTLPLKIENIETAKSNIMKLFNNILKNYCSINNIFFQKNLTYENIIEINENQDNYQEFHKFIGWLVSKKVKNYKKIEILTEVFLKMEDSQSKYYIIFEPMLKDLSNLDNDDSEDYIDYLNLDDNISFNVIRKKKIDFSPIVYHNILFKFREILIERYNLLENYGFNISRCLRENNKIKLMNNIPLLFPPFNEKEFINKIKEKYNIGEIGIKEKLSEIWKFSEMQSNPIPIIKKTEEKSHISSEKAESKKIQNLKLIQIKELSDAISLNRIISVLSNGYKVSKSFEFYIENDKSKISQIFNYLYEIYNKTKNATNSILSKEIKIFSNSFEELCQSLIDSGVDLKKFKELNFSCKEKEILENVEKPKPKIIQFLKEIDWKGKQLKKSENDNSFKLKEIEMEKSESQNAMNNKIQLKKNEQNNSKEQIEFEQPKGIGMETILLMNNDSDDDEENQDRAYVKITDNIVEFKGEEKNKIKHIEEKITKNRVKRMLSKEIDSNLNLPKNFPEICKDRDNIFKKSINRNKGEDLINEPLYVLFNDYSENLFIKLYQQCSDFDKKDVCSVIAVDLCRTINNKFKLFHTIIATAMANCFNSIDIPYSIVVFCDYEVQFIIKDFDEPHQENISQLIFDAITVPRTLTRIADACYFINQKVNCNQKLNKKVFIISNGLDTKLKIGEKWTPIFNNKNETFCFFFIKSEELSEKDLNNIENIWNDFQEKTKIKIAKIHQEDILEGKHSIILPFKETMNTKISINNEILKKKNIQQPDFKEVVEFDKDDYIKMLDSVDLLKKKNKITDFFIQNEIHIQSQGKYQSEELIIKNPFLTLKSECKNEDYNFERNVQDTKEKLEKLFSDIICSEMKKEYLDFVFPQNKPSMYSPSSKGTRLYLMGLINFCITHGQDNKIWLEKNKGLKRDYRVSVIIDSSISCFNEQMRPHSINTVLAVLRMLSLVEIPYFDLIIATDSKPIVLSCGNDTTNCLNFKSKLWNIVLEQLTHNQVECNLFDSLQLVYKLKSLNYVKKYYAFVLTDGLFEQEEKRILQDYISFCEESCLQIFGIGLGYYPNGIRKIFSKCIWSMNPFMILKAMTVFFGNSEKPLDSISQDIIFSKNFGELKNKFTIIINKISSYQVYKELYGFLDSLPLKIESLEEIANRDLADGFGELNPSISEDNTMCKKGEFKGFKILIGIFWSFILSEKESKWVDKNYLLERYVKEKECLKEVLEYYSIEIIIKEDYKECIEELQTGNYYAHWVICGDGQKILPNGGNPYLIRQYIDALKIYWINGGSIIFWNDNEPFTYECNLFLENVEFQGETTKTQVRFGGNHEGKRVMKPGDISKKFEGESEFGTFNKKRKFSDGKYEMFSLGHNLVKIAEGTTVSYVIDPDKYKPFNIFGYDHQGGINILFYTPPLKYNHGYLVIDGGFTKLFNELDSEGTKRYILNIASFTTQFTKRLGEIGENWKTNFKIPPFSFKINETVKWDYNTRITNEFDIIYLLDATGSMGNYLSAARDQCINISNQLKAELPEFDFNFGAVFYRDPVDCPNEKNKVYPLTNDVNILKSQIASESATGGGDGPEDWVGAYDQALNNIAWRNGTRLIIHITDSPAHGSEWCAENNHNEENPKLYPIIQECVEKNIKIIGFQIGEYPYYCFSKFEKEYKFRGGLFYKINYFKNSINSSEISILFKDIVIKSVHAAAPKE